MTLKLTIDFEVGGIQVVKKGAVIVKDGCTTLLM